MHSKVHVALEKHWTTNACQVFHIFLYKIMNEPKSEEMLNKQAY